MIAITPRPLELMTRNFVGTFKKKNVHVFLWSLYHYFLRRLLGNTAYDVISYTPPSSATRFYIGLGTTRNFNNCQCYKS